MNAGPTTMTEPENSLEPVRKQIVIDAPQEHVFKVFTRDIDTWWPRQHHIGTSPLERAMLEPRQGGRWYAINKDGSECDTGTVLVWEPPRRLVLAWQITGDWQYDPNFVTEVEVTFTAEGPRKTRVDLEHRNLERYGASAAKLRKGIDAPDGWGLILQRLANAAGQ
ncbi:MAG: hypothetical protein JWM41_972 [Gemmatimonadetes bacterium]|nr:hypothetical protein [Gemmatimonadota bacterium]